MLTKTNHLLIFLAMLVSSCIKENLVVIEPFKNFYPQAEVSGQSVHIQAKLPKHNYEEVGVTYSFEKKELTIGMTSEQILMLEKNSGEYTCTLEQLPYNTILYYRVYVKNKGEIYLSNIYEINIHKYNIRLKDNQGWIFQDEENRFKLTLLGDELDTDVSKYRIDDITGDAKVTSIVKNSIGNFEIHIDGQLTLLKNYSDFSLTLLYNDQIIFYKHNFKLAPPPGYGLYKLRKINSKSRAGVGGFIYNSQLYAIGEGKIEIYNEEQNFWFFEKEIKNTYHFNRSSSFQVDNDIYFSAFEQDKPNVDQAQKSVYLVKLNLKDFSLENVKFTADHLPPPDSYGYQISIFKCNDKQYACITTSKGDFGNFFNNDLYIIDAESKKMTYLQRLSATDRNILLFGYKGKLFALENNPSKSNPQAEVYGMMLYEIDTVTKTSKIIKEYVGKDRRFITAAADGKDIWMVGVNRALFHLDLETYAQTYLIHMNLVDGQYTNDFLDWSEVQGRIFQLNNRWIFGFGFHTSGLFEFAMQHYD